MAPTNESNAAQEHAACSAAQQTGGVSFTQDEERLIDEIKRVGHVIRQLKLDDNAEEEELAVLIAKLNGLKKNVARPVIRELEKLLTELETKSDDDDSTEKELESHCKSLLDILPLNKTKKRIEKHLRAAKKAREVAKLNRFDRKLYTDRLRVQRKIHHLLESKGSGNTFCYFPNRLASQQHGIVANDPDCLIVLTEKWDGTTVQATNKGVFKRCDKFVNGDPKKHAADEDERYGIERLNIGFDEFLQHGSISKAAKYDEPAKYIQEAVEKYYHAFAGLEDGLCVYFEAVGTRIQARFPAVSETEQWHDIRVFDFAKNGRFLPWAETRALAERHHLPIVGYTSPAPLDLPLLLEKLGSGLYYQTSEASYHPAGRALLEGYVIRGVLPRGSIESDQEEPIAKFRVDDIGQFCSNDCPNVEKRK